MQACTLSDSIRIARLPADAVCAVIMQNRDFSLDSVLEIIAILILKIITALLSVLWIMNQTVP